MKIVYAKQPIKFLKKLPAKTRNRIIDAIAQLPKAGDIKKLKGLDGYRLRVGDYRVIFNHEGGVFIIYKIDNRGQAYK